MNKSKNFFPIELVTIAGLLVWGAQPVTAGNKTSVSPSGQGKVEASITYGTGLTTAKTPATGVAGTVSVAIPAAGVNPAAGPSGFPTTGNVTTTGLPTGCPTTVYCTVSTAFVTGGYKAIVRSYVTGGATADNAELEVKIPITAAACASYNAESEFVATTATSGKLQLSGEATAGTAVWIRALYYTGTETDPSRSELTENSVLRGELVVAGPFNTALEGCPITVPVTFEDASKIYLLVDSVAKSVPYTMTCEDAVLECTNGSMQYPLPTITGGCETDGEAIVTYSIAPNDLPYNVPTQVTATARGEDNSLLATCTFTATVRDTQKPVVPTLSPVTGQCSATVTAPTTTDACVGSVIGTTTDPLTYNAQGNFTVHWSFNDGHGNTSTANQTVTVKDTVAPVTPTLATVNGSCSSPVTLTAPTTTDNCAGTVTGTTGDPLVYSVPGTYTVHWTFSDGNGNSTTANQTVNLGGFTFKGLYSPVGTINNSCSGSSLVSVNKGSVVPLKFDFYCGTTRITSGDKPTLTIQPVLSNCSVTGSPTTVIADYQNDWHYNWDTSTWPKATYKVIINLPDGVTKPFVFIRLK